MPGKRPLNTKTAATTVTANLSTGPVVIHPPPLLYSIKSTLFSNANYSICFLVDKEYKFDSKWLAFDVYIDHYDYASATLDRKKKETKGCPWMADELSF